MQYQLRWTHNLLLLRFCQQCYKYSAAKSVVGPTHVKDVLNSFPYLLYSSWNQSSHYVFISHICYILAPVLRTPLWHSVWHVSTFISNPILSFFFNAQFDAVFVFPRSAWRSLCRFWDMHYVTRPLKVRHITSLVLRSYELVGLLVVRPFWDD